LGFDIARENYVLYFDCNGGHAKVKQRDVLLFHLACRGVNAKLECLGSPTDEQRDDAFDCPIRALFVSRLIMLCFLRQKQSDLTPWKWLLLQIHYPNLCSKLFQECLELSQAACLQVCERLLVSDRSVFVTLDEAQALMQYQWWWRAEGSDGSELPSKISDQHDNRRPLGKRVLQVLTILELESLYVCATDMRVKSYQTWASAAGMTAGMLARAVHHYAFDFTGGPILLSDDPSAALGEGDADFPRLWRNGVCLFLRYCFQTDDQADDAIDSVFNSVAFTLQGRPRFVAAFVCQVVMELLNQERKEISFAECLQEQFKKYVGDQMSLQLPTSIRSLWEKVLSENTSPRKGQAGTPVTLWELVRPVLVSSVLSRHGAPQGKAGISQNPDLVSRGIALLSPTGKEQFIYEPLVMSVGLTACAENKVNMIAHLEARFQDCNESAQDHGRLLELMLAWRLFEDPRRLHHSLKLKQPPASSYLGILIGVPLDDPRVTFDGGASWIILPEEQAGPDVIAFPFVASCKYTSRKDAVPADASRESMRTSDISLVYSSKTRKTIKKDGAHCLYASRGKVSRAAVKNKEMIKVRVEVPQAALSCRPKQGVTTCQRDDGKVEELIYVSSQGSGSEAYKALGLVAPRQPSKRQKR
jgi:hypothetical protein